MADDETWDEDEQVGMYKRSLLADRRRTADEETWGEDEDEQVGKFFAASRPVMKECSFLLKKYVGTESGVNHFHVCYDLRQHESIVSNSLMNNICNVLQAGKSKPGALIPHTPGTSSARGGRGHLERSDTSFVVSNVLRMVVVVSHDSTSTTTMRIIMGTEMVDLVTRHDTHWSSQLVSDDH